MVPEVTCRAFRRWPSTERPSVDKKPACCEKVSRHHRHIELRGGPPNRPSGGHSAPRDCYAPEKYRECDWRRFSSLALATATISISGSLLDRSKRNRSRVAAESESNFSHRTVPFLRWYSIKNAGMELVTFLSARYLTVL